MCQDKVCGVAPLPATNARVATLKPKTKVSPRSYGGMVSPRMITVLQFCALCCLQAACQCCAASHAAGHDNNHAVITPSRALSSVDQYPVVDTQEWTIMDGDASNDTSSDDADQIWVRPLCYLCCLHLLLLHYMGRRDAC